MPITSLITMLYVKSTPFSSWKMAVGRLVQSDVPGCLYITYLVVEHVLARIKTGR